MKYLSMSHYFTEPKADENDNGEEDLPSFDFRTIANATNNFSNNNKLGEGGFGPVFKVIILFHLPTTTRFS